jgi:hypothetical protein
MKIVVFLTLMHLLKILVLDSLVRMLGLGHFISSSPKVFGVSLFGLIVLWIIPGLITLIFISASNLNKRYTPSFAGPCLAVAMILSYAGVGLYIASTFVEGGGASFVVGAFLGYFQPVIRLLLMVGLIKMFLSLGPPIPRHNQQISDV